MPKVTEKNTNSAEDGHVESDHSHALWRAVLQLRNAEECERFFRDLCTPGEIKDMGERWYLARRLDGKKTPYRQLNQETGISTTTIGRVARFLTQESYQGYRLILDRIKEIDNDKTSNSESRNWPAYSSE